MIKIYKEKDEWGQYIINVLECDNFKYENPDIIKDKNFYLHNPELKRIDDIIYKEENYFNNSGNQIQCKIVEGMKVSN